MSLTDLAAIASIISSVAVLATLVYLNIQTRQSDRNRRSMLVQARTANQVDGWLLMTEANVAAAPLKARSDPANLSEFQLYQYLAQQRAACRQIFAQFRTFKYCVTLCAAQGTCGTCTRVGPASALQHKSAAARAG